MTIDEVLTRGHDKDFEIVEQMLLSGQIDDARIQELLATYPKFADWLARRATYTGNRHQEA